MQRIINFYQQLQPESLANINQLYASNAQFKDPFNDVQGLEPITAIFRHMFAVLHEPRFTIQTAISESDQAFITWVFSFRYKRAAKSLQTIQGGTHIIFDETQRIQLHQDYWDPAEQLYEKWPVLGILMRWLKRQAKS